MHEPAPRNVGPLKLSEPRYPPDAFAPHISAATVRAQRDWQATQMRTVNDALNRFPEWYGLSIETLLRRVPEMPATLASVITSHGAGFANHQFFWKIVRPPPSSAPGGELLADIQRDFGSLRGLQMRFNNAATRLGGDGWVFLVMNPDDGMRLDIVALPGDASVLPLRRPGVLVCDLWRHAWADDHASLGAWLDAFWQLVDWEIATARREGILAGRQQL